MCNLSPKEVKEHLEWRLGPVGEEFIDPPDYNMDDHMDSHYDELGAMDRQIEVFKKKLIEEAL